MAVAWYADSVFNFIKEPVKQIADHLVSEAVNQGFTIEPEQRDEWYNSIEIVKNGVNEESEKLKVIKDSLKKIDSGLIESIILEYDIRRRGLRIDCVILAEGTIFVIEFKKAKLSSASHEQILHYCINLHEFHQVTREYCLEKKFQLIPILVTTGNDMFGIRWLENGKGSSWEGLNSRAIECDKENLHKVLKQVFSTRKSVERIKQERWLNSNFQPSSTILDAALSLYGEHTVSAIKEHSLPKKAIDAATKEILQITQSKLAKKKNHIIFLSGTPGSGKTLVGLNLAFHPSLRDNAVFVTGNAPLVEVLTEALTLSYNKKNNKSLIGYLKKDFKYVAKNAIFKIVKAHHFLGKRGKSHGSTDGRVIIFDEAQRTYKKGKEVLRERLVDHEADLIMIAQEKQYESSVIIALLGHNQVINNGERGAVAWLEAARRRDWTYSISDETRGLQEFTNNQAALTSNLQQTMKNGHLSHSMRFYRSEEIEHWVHAVLKGDSKKAKIIAELLRKNNGIPFITRDLNVAKAWVFSKLIGEIRGGMVASSQGKRLSSEGLFVSLKPSIGKWMLTPSDDIRSSNMLETIQNQFQIQGLELDYTIVCWDADLRYEKQGWQSYKISGSKWQKDSNIEFAINGYRVLLTRSRKGMVIYVPYGDKRKIDTTRETSFYDGIYNYLLECGVEQLE